VVKLAQQFLYPTRLKGRVAQLV